MMFLYLPLTGLRFRLNPPPGVAGPGLLPPDLIFQSQILRQTLLPAPPVPQISGHVEVEPEPVGHSETLNTIQTLAKNHHWLVYPVSQTKIAGLLPHSSSRSDCSHRLD